MTAKKTPEIKKKIASKPKAPKEPPVVTMRIGANREIKQMGYLKAKVAEGNDVIVEASGRRIAQAAIVIGPLICEERFRIPGLKILHHEFERFETEEKKGYYVARWKVGVRL